MQRIPNRFWVIFSNDYGPILQPIYSSKYDQIKKNVTELYFAKGTLIDVSIETGITSNRQHYCFTKKSNNSNCISCLTKFC